MRQLSLFVALLILMFSCKSTKDQSNNSSDSKETEETKTTDEIMFFTVSFTSIGSGIQTDAVKKLITTINDYSSDTNLDLNYEIIRWGREGERDYCFNMQSIPGNTRTDVIKTIKNNLVDFSQVQYKSGKECLHQN